MLSDDLKLEVYKLTKNGLKQVKDFSSEYEMELIDYVFEKLNEENNGEEFSIEECLKIAEGIDDAIKSQ